MSIIIFLSKKLITHSLAKDGIIIFNKIGELLAVNLMLSLRQAWIDVRGEIRWRENFCCIIDLELLLLNARILPTDLSALFRFVLKMRNDKNIYRGRCSKITREKRPISSLVFFYILTFFPIFLNTCTLFRC